MLSILLLVLKSYKIWWSHPFPLWNLNSPGCDRHRSDAVWCCFPRSRTEGSPWCCWRRPETDPAYCSATLDRGLRSNLQPARWNAQPDQTRRTERGLPQVAHRGCSRMRAIRFVFVAARVSWIYEVSAGKGLVCGWPGKKSTRGKNKATRNSCCSCSYLVFHMAPSYINVPDVLFCCSSALLLLALWNKCKHHHLFLVKSAWRNAFIWSTPMLGQDGGTVRQML